MTFTYRVLLKPSDICFKTKLLPSSFDNGIPLRETLQQLSNEEILIEDLPSIDVVWCQKKWVWYTLNSRRLWVFRELEKLGKCQYIATKRVETIEHMTDFLLYGSAELIGESNVVEWDDDGIKITLFNGEKSGKEATTHDCKAKEQQGDQTTVKESKEDGKIRRDWRELTPLTVTVKWNEAGKQSDAEPEERLVTPDLDKQARHSSRHESEESKRERKDSGYSEISSGRTSPGDGSSCTASEFSETEFSRGSTRRFSKFHCDRPYYPSTSYARSSSITPHVKSSAKSRRIMRSIKPQSKRFRVSRPRSRPPTFEALKASAFHRRGIYDQMMFLLHHGGKPRLEQLALKTKLMNTCGFCFKGFRAAVSLSQHVEELQHWACTRCGKYFGSYTALGQHKLDLDHCNV